MVGNVMAAKTLSINQTVNGASCGLNQAPLSIDIENFPLSLPRNFGQKVLSNNMTTFWQVGHVTNTLDIIRAVHWVNVEMLHFIRIVVFAHYVLINIHIRECFNDTYWSGGPPTPQLRPTPFRLLFSSAARNRHNLGTIFNSTVAPDASPQMHSGPASGFWKHCVFFNRNAASLMQNIAGGDSYGFSFEFVLLFIVMAKIKKYFLPFWIFRYLNPWFGQEWNARLLFQKLCLKVLFLMKLCFMVANIC